MTDLFPAATTADVRMAAKIAEIEREIKIRQGVYPRWVLAGKLTQELADRRILVLQAILEDLQTGWS